MSRVVAVIKRRRRRRRRDVYAVQRRSYATGGVQQWVGRVGKVQAAPEFQAEKKLK